MAAEKRDLTNKPLVEAVFELRWSLAEAGTPGMQRDPHYAILPGLLYEQVRGTYPYTEALPAAAMPGELIAHIVQHRFRVAVDAWPVVQLGPGIVTANETVGYNWVSFQQQIDQLVKALMKAYPNPEALSFSAVILRYINAEAFDYESNNALAFLRDRLHVSLQLPDELFASGVVPNPLGFDLRSVFKAPSLAGAINLRFAAGQRDEKPTVIWELAAQAVDDDAPQDADAVVDWATRAHHVLEDWFFELIDGELYEAYR